MVAENIQFNPAADFILVKPLKRHETPGGVVLPDGSDPDPPKGRVVKVGPGRQNEEGNTLPMRTKVGDVVYLYFVYQQPIAIKLGGEDYIVVRDRDVMAYVGTQ